MKTFDQRNDRPDFPSFEMKRFHCRIGPVDLGFWRESVNQDTQEKAA
jgi:hypothetical protein